MSTDDGGILEEALSKFGCSTAQSDFLVEQRCHFGFSYSYYNLCKNTSGIPTNFRYSMIGENDGATTSACKTNYIGAGNFLTNNSLPMR